MKFLFEFDEKFLRLSRKAGLVVFCFSILSAIALSSFYLYTKNDVIWYHQNLESIELNEFQSFATLPPELKESIGALSKKYAVQRKKIITRQ
jgi:hypothetical protein